MSLAGESVSHALREFVITEAMQQDLELHPVCAGLLPACPPIATINLLKINMLCSLLGDSSPNGFSGPDDKIIPSGTRAMTVARLPVGAVDSTGASKRRERDTAFRDLPVT